MGLYILVVYGGAYWHGEVDVWGTLVPGLGSSIV